MPLLLKPWLIKNLTDQSVLLSINNEELHLAPHGEVWITSRDPRPVLANLIAVGTIEVSRDG